MKGLHVCYHLVRADFLERTRRYSTLAVIGLTICLTYLYLPPLDARYLAFNLDGYRGVYNSAWVGATVTVMIVVLMPFLGFYVVKSAIRLDRRTGVGQIIATTPLSKIQYTLGKTLSNWIYLAAMAAVAMLAAMGIQLVRGEVLRLALGDYLGPYLFLVLPMMAFVAALAVLFEAIPWLRGGLGNVVYFFLFLGGYWMLLGLTFTVLISNTDVAGVPIGLPPEPTGALNIFQGMIGASRVLFPGSSGGLELFHWAPAGANISVETFVWEGLAWTRILLAGRLLWVCVAIGLAALAASFFDRFDPVQESVTAQHEGEPPQKGTTTESVSLWTPPPLLNSVHLTPLRGAGHASWLNSLGRSALSELRLLLKGLRWWWYAIAGGLIVAGVLSPANQTRQIWLPLAWLWPVLVWSPLGNRVVLHRMDQIIFSSAFPCRRQLPAAWLAGLILAWSTGSGAAVRLLLDGQWGALSAWFVGAAFIPALALALGVWSGGSKLFEVTYLVLWTLGPLDNILAALDVGRMFGAMVVMDLFGATDDAVIRGVPLCYMGLTALLLGLAFAGRRRQLCR